MPLIAARFSALPSRAMDLSRSVVPSHPVSRILPNIIGPQSLISPAIIAGVYKLSVFKNPCSSVPSVVPHPIHFLSSICYFLCAHRPVPHPGLRNFPGKNARHCTFCTILQIAPSCKMPKQKGDGIAPTASRKNYVLAYNPLAIICLIKSPTRLL